MLTLRGLVSSARYSVHQALLRRRLRKREEPLAQTHHPLIQRPLVDLAIERADFAGVLTPADEVGAAREGVDHVFLDDAEEYYRKYQSFDYWRALLGLAIIAIVLAFPRGIVGGAMDLRSRFGLGPAGPREGAAA